MDIADCIIFGIFLVVALCVSPTSGKDRSFTQHISECTFVFITILYYTMIYYSILFNSILIIFNFLLFNYLYNEDF